MAQRTFVVTISEAPARVMVEDVRNRRRTVAPRLADVGTEIAHLLEAPNRPTERDDVPTRGVL
jgi:hypothetical protein